MIDTDTILSERYRIERLVGRGGMAEVYRAVDLRLRRPVAVKVLAGWLASDPSYLARFRREARAAAALHHPNVVAVFDAGNDGGTHYIVMEFVQGRTLEDVLRDEGPLPPERAVEVAGSVAEALGAAHARGIVHRDVKPANIMVTEGWRVKVTDFGIARADSLLTATQTGTVFGTARYVAPEQARGQRADARADLYSLGVVLYELLAGTPPFVGDTPLSIAMQHISAEPEPPSSHRPGIPPELDDVVSHALEKDPDRRFQTAAEFRAGLRSLGPALAGAGPAAERPPDPGATRPLAAIVPEGPGDRTATTDPLEGEEAGPSRRGRALAVLGVATLAALLALLVWRPWAEEPTATREPAPGATSSPPETPSPSPTQSPSPSPSPSPTQSPSPSPSPSPEEAYAAARAELEGIIAEGQTLREIEPKAASELRKKLREADQEAGRGNAEKALEKLDDLREKVDDFLEGGEITSDDRADAILVATDRLEEALKELLGV